MGFVVVLFAGATMYSQRLLGTDVDALDIASNAAPSIAELADARGELPALDHAADDFLLARDEAGRDRARAAFQAARRALDRELAAYEQTPNYPGEQAAYARVKEQLRRLDADLLGSAYGTGPTALPRMRAQMRAVDDGLHAVSDINRHYLNTSSQTIARSGRRRNLYALLLDGIAIALATLATVMASRYVNRHIATLARRAKELEHLAIQVGHEIANPLTPIQVALRFGTESSDEHLRTASERATHALTRIRGSIDRLIDFARASQPAGARTRAPLAAALKEAAGAAGLDVTVDAELRVACSEEHLREILRGLFVGSVAPGQHGPLSARVSTSSSWVRIDVESPPDEGATSDPFDPQLRDPESGLPGMDLRLATVRRQVEACGGRVGVRQRRPRQCLWIQLPRA
jgi:signal transduction histidine kinase